MNRREFAALLGAAATWPARAYAQQQAAPSSPIRLDWLNRRKEPILEPELPIVDPHHHLWQRPGWRYLLEDLLLDTGSGHNIVATVYMEARSMYRDQGPVEMRPVGETEFANGIAAMCSSGAFGKTRVAAGIVGHADLTLGSRVEPVLSALMRAGGERFRGIRHGVSWDADPAIVSPASPVHAGLLADKTFREGVAVLSRLGLSYDVSLYHPQINELADLAGAFLAFFVDGLEDVIAWRELTGVDEKAPFFDQRRSPLSRLQHDAFRSLHDFQITAFVQTQPVTHRFRQDRGEQLRALRGVVAVVLGTEHDEAQSDEAHSDGTGEIALRQMRQNGAPYSFWESQV